MTSALEAATPHAYTGRRRTAMGKRVRKPKAQPKPRGVGKPPSEPTTALGKWLREARGERTVEDVSAAAGCSLRHWHKLEAGTSDSPRQSLRIAICAALGKRIQEMPE